MKQLFTTSRARSWQRCAQLHHLKYDLRIAAIKPEGMQTRFGTLWHDGQDRYWTEGKNLEAALDALDALDADPIDRAKARALLRGYHDHWLADGLSTLAVEQEFRTPLRNPDTMRNSRRFDLGGKIDLLVADQHGAIYFVEHKSSSEDISPGALYWARTTLDDQISNYHDGSESLGHDLAGCIYDVALRPAHSQKLATPEEKRRYTKGKGCKLCCKGARAGNQGIGCAACSGSGWEDSPRLDKRQRDRDETISEFEDRVYAEICAEPARFFQRLTVVRLQDELNAMRANRWAIAQDMIRDQRRPVHPLNTQSCTDFRRLCDFHAYCSGQARLDDRNVFKIRDRIHPELTTEVQKENRHNEQSNSGSAAADGAASVSDADPW